MKNIIFTLVILTIILSGAYFIYSKENSVEVSQNAEMATTTATSTPQEVNEVKTGTDIFKVGGLDYQIVEETVSTSTINKLNLDTLKKELVFPITNPVEINKKYEVDIKKIIAILVEKPENFEKWIELGTFRKMINDYEGAMEAWVNATIIQPKNALPESSIGNLLGYYMKEPISAEKHYLKSIELEPNVGFWYYQTFMFYKEVMKDDNKAKAIIEKGVKNIPQDLELAEILKSL